MTQFPQTATGVALVPPWACHAVDPHLEATVGELRTRGFELLSQLRGAGGRSALNCRRRRLAGRGEQDVAGLDVGDHIAMAEG